MSMEQSNAGISKIDDYSPHSHLTDFAPGLCGETPSRHIHRSPSEPMRLPQCLGYTHGWNLDQ
jgi:hypothetical protein